MNRMRYNLLEAVVVCSVAAMLISSCRGDGRYDTDAIRNAVISQMEEYPESELQDLYKNFFQDAFGPGHLLDDSEDARRGAEAYLRAECQAAMNDSVSGAGMPDYELIGWHHRFYRVNLSVINDGRIPFDVYLDAFMKSAQQFSLPSIDDWKREWAAIETEIRNLDYPIEGFEEDAREIHRILSEGQYALHHSDRYNDCYHPHYRLIEKSVFEEMLLPRL